MKKYKWLLFLSRVAFICNVIFVFCLVIAFIQAHSEKVVDLGESIKSYTVILGYFVSFGLNVIVQLAGLVIRIAKRESPVKGWLRVVNLTVFIIQLVYYFL